MDCKSKIEKSKIAGIVSAEEMRVSGRRVR